MKNCITVLVFLLNLAAIAQDSFNKNESVYEINTTNTEILESNINFILTPTKANTKLSDVGSAFFKNKYIIYSSRKTGEIGIGKDNITNQPFTNLYCLNVDETGNLSKPLFFSRLIKSDGNQGGLTFSPNEKVMYYTKSNKGNSSNYQLFKSDFDVVSNSKWTNEEPIAFNSPDYSIENPFVTADGKKMYFTSNMPGGFGGYDLYVAEINEFNLPVNPVNLGKEINSSADETHPYISRNQKNIYFSSNGHSGFGGKDVFVSTIYKSSFSNPVNLGKSINTSADEVAFILASKSSGYVSSNRENTIGSYDVFKFDMFKNENKLSDSSYETDNIITFPNTEVSFLNNESIVAKNK